MKPEGSPRSIVAERNFDAAKVIVTPNSITAVTTAAETTEPPNPPAPAKKTAVSVMMNGNFPLQGTNALVSIAMSRSRLLSIMRQPTIPAALQPKPIAIVSACFPQALHFWNGLSRL
ncbi:resolvase domain protein [Eubacterium sp. CAG:786]|nr:resolvase domain protein [Eubacterium sp. CAG:786]